MTESEKQFCLMHIQKAVSEENMMFADNFRMATVGNAEEEGEYELAKDNGCCGFYDVVIKGDTVDYRIGCNYGH